ncbi:MAG: hypothetical protein RLZZ373_1038 [Pseudomonadota bacterium]
MATNDTSRLRIANRIHDLVFHELGEDVNIALMLGPAEYSRAVLSLCRACGSSELARLAEQFLRASDEDTLRQRSQQITRYAEAVERLPGVAPSTTSHAVARRVV